MRGKVPKIPVRAALVRTDLWLGCDRIGLTAAGAVSALVGIGGGVALGEWKLALLGGAMFWSFRELLRKLAKIDPKFVWIYLRALRERPVYDRVARWDADGLSPRSWK